VTACPICHSAESWQIPFARDAQADAARAEAGDIAPYDWRLCRRCGNAYPSHPPFRPALQKIWDINRTDEKAGVAEKARIWAYRRSIARAGASCSYRLFARLAAKAKGRFLDIGCGLGETVRIFAEHGWGAEGIDADPSTAATHREVVIKTRIGQFEDIAPEGVYDIVHIAHAIYFITEPMAFMRKVRERLAPDGLFCVVLADFLANSDTALPGYVHTFFPTARSMRYALALAGFETVLSRRMSGSVFMAARPRANPPMPWVSPAAVWLLHRSKMLRYRLIGRPYLWLRGVAKTVLGRR